MDNRSTRTSLEPESWALLTAVTLVLKQVSVLLHHKHAAVIASQVPYEHQVACSCGNKGELTTSSMQQDNSHNPLHPGWCWSFPWGTRPGQICLGLPTHAGLWYPPESCTHTHSVGWQQFSCTLNLHIPNFNQSGFSCGNHQPKVFFEIPDVSAGDFRKRTLSDATQLDKLLQSTSTVHLILTYVCTYIDTCIVYIEVPM